MKEPRTIHVVGTGTIGEPLIGLLLHLRQELALDDITFHKHSPRLEDRFVQVVSCNTHNLAVLIHTLGLHGEARDNLVEGRFVCMRRASDISQEKSFIPAPDVGVHSDARFGTHHARDGHDITGFCFTPQDGNSLLSSLATATWLLDPEAVDVPLQFAQPYMFDEI